MLPPLRDRSKVTYSRGQGYSCKEAYQEYSLKEEDVAKDLGITQAGSQQLRQGNKRRHRGCISKLESVREVMRMIDDIAKDPSDKQSIHSKHACQIRGSVQLHALYTHYMRRSPQH